MMTGHGKGDLAVGGPARHIPVLLGEVLAALSAQPGETIIDGTFGAGGYTTAILKTGASVIGIDRDPDAIAAGRTIEAASDGRLTLVHAPFSRLDECAEQVDGVVLDIGVSSMQLDQAERGFSFRADGPLDMRMAQQGPSAADVVNRMKPEDLTRIFGLLGEERHAGRIARMIEKRRERHPFETTLDLADGMDTHGGLSPKDKIHPAARVCPAALLFVNDELGELAQALFAAERVLKPGGRLVVVTFHSLEDRIVKRFIADRSENPAGSRHMPAVRAQAETFRKMGGAVAPSQEEVEANPRARSAKLRAAVRTGEPPRGEDVSMFGFPKLPDLVG